MAAHLGLAMALLALLLYVVRASRDPADRAPPRPPRPRVAGCAPGAGRLGVRAVHDRRRRLHGRHAELRPRRTTSSATAPTTPAARSSRPCNGDFMPFGQARLVDIHLTHRVFMYLASLLVIALVVVALRRRPSARDRPRAWLAAAVLVAPGARGRAQRVARRVRGADRAAPGARHRCCGRASSALAFQLYPVRVPPGRPAAPSRAEAVAA